MRMAPRALILAAVALDNQQSRALGGQRLWALKRATRLRSIDFTNAGYIQPALLQQLFDGERGARLERLRLNFCVPRQLLSVIASSCTGLKELSLRNVFECGQMYVALSRATSLESLSLTDIDFARLQAHPKALAFARQTQQAH